MRNSRLPSLFFAVAMFGGVYGLSEQAQALEQSEHCYSATEISDAMKAEGQFLVAMGYEVFKGTDREESRFFYFNPDTHTGYIIEGDDNKPVQCAKVIGRLVRTNLFDNSIPGVDPAAQIQVAAETNNDKSVLAGACSEANARTCYPHNETLAKLDAKGIRVIFQGTGAESYEESDVRNYNERLLRKGTIVTIAARIKLDNKPPTQDDEVGVIIHTDQNGNASFVGYYSTIDYLKKGLELIDNRSKSLVK